MVHGVSREYFVAETEKITINLNVVDLGKIDLLVDEGFYTNRTDFIRTAIRKELDEQKIYIESSITRQHKVVGIVRYTAKDLQAYRERGEMIDIRVVGFLNIANDVSVELAEETISSIEIQGVSTMSKEIGFRLRDLGRMEWAMQLAHFLYLFGELLVGLLCIAGVLLFSPKRKRKNKREE